MSRPSYIGTLFLVLSLIACSGSKETKSESSSSGDRTHKVSKEKLKSSKVKVSGPKIDTNAKKGGSKKDTKGNEDLFLFHKRTPCYGRCPVYTLKVRKNGRAELKAKQFTDLEKGSYKGRIGKKELNKLKEKARSIGFFELKKAYDDENVTDLPTRITKMNFNGKQHKVRNRYGGPDGLEELEKLIQKIVKGTEWTSAPSDE